ncbi:TonB-dependent receptor, partial [candidate division KSB1 bacterium]|nr:TonB-dependent receptor [candidate division KSB1 bacterium]
MRELSHRRLVLLLMVLLITWHTFAIAGTTGKIVGAIVDGVSGEPLPGVNVLVQGTTLGAATDLQGRYMIMGIPPGGYRLEASMIGYNKSVVENVRVRIDLTTTINVQLSQTVLDAGETVTVVAERPLVQLDMTSSLATIGSDEIDLLPAQSVQGVLELQAGVINYGGLHIRGGRSGEVAYWVDGVATTDVFDGGSGVTVENSAIEELQVVSGTFNAEYGQAMSGIVNIITKEGGTRYSGQFKGYIGDYLSADDLYNVLTRSDVVENDDNTMSLFEESENPLKKLNPSYDAEFSLSGPFPFSSNKVTFFVNGRYFLNEGYLYGRDWFRPQGIPGDSALVPMNPYESRSLQGKLTWKPISNFKLSYNAFWSGYDVDRYFNRTYKYNPYGVAQSHGSGMTHILTFSHVLSSNTFYEVKLNRFYQDYERYVHEDPLAHPHWMVRIPADSLNEERIIDLETDQGQQDFTGVKQEGLEYDFFVNPDRPDGYVHPDSARDPASYSFYRAGNDLSHFYRSTSYWVGKFDITSQVNQKHQLKAGIDVKIYELTLDSYTLQAKKVPGFDEQIVPFTPEIPDISTIYHDKYNQKPRELAAYVQDKIELSDMNVNLGLRFDYFDANSVIPADPGDPNIYDPFLDENIYKNPETPEDQRIEYTPEQRRVFMHKKVNAKMQISPRLGIAYPITDKGMIHFSYGHFLQIPEFQYLYDSPDFKMNSGGGRTIVGNADLKPQKTIQYEVGLAQEIIKNVGLDVTLFYRDIRNWVGTSPVIKTHRASVSYVIYENKDYSNVRGVNIKLEKRMADSFSARIDYGYQVAEGTYSNPTDAFNALSANEEPRLNLIPLAWDQRHTLNAQLVFARNGWTASLISRYYTGTPYTPSFARGAYVGSTAMSGLRENSSRKPNINTYDIYITRAVDIANLKFTFFLYGYNIFDQRMETGVFSDTGTASYTTYPIL